MLDRRGEMGFMEAIVCMMAVCIVLGLYFGLVADTALTSVEDLRGFDMGSLDGSIVDGTFVPEYTDYLESYLGRTGAEGIEVTVSVPSFGIFATCILGSMDGNTVSRSHVSTVEDEQGRVLIAVYQVILCL